MDAARDVALGPREIRTDVRGGVPVERYSTGGHLKPVKPGIRCYPLGMTYEKPTAIGAPNANGKVVGGRVDPNTKDRVELMKVRRCMVMVGGQRQKGRDRCQGFPVITDEQISTRPSRYETDAR